MVLEIEQSENLLIVTSIFNYFTEYIFLSEDCLFFNVVKKGINQKRGKFK